jgi:DNA-binding transcriptional LysR family regulator
MGVEQSTLSRAILKLERSIRMSIFERSRAGVTMTLAGNAFVCGARRMEATADKLVAMMRAAGQGRAGGLMLGHNSSVSAGNLRATMMSWRDAQPDVEVECVEANRSALLAGLDTGEIDIAILMGAAGHDGFRCGPLWSERMLVALPAGRQCLGSDFVPLLSSLSRRQAMTCSKLLTSRINHRLVDLGESARRPTRRSKMRRVQARGRLLLDRYSELWSGRSRLAVFDIEGLDAGIKRAHG